MSTVREQLQSSAVIDAEEVPELSMEHKNFIAGLRELAAFYEQRPELEVPRPDPVMYLFSKAEDVGKIAKLLGKAQKKVQGDSFFCLVRKFGPIELQASWSRDEVCERVQTGIRTIPAVHREEHEEPVYEWKCPKIVAPRLPEAQE